MYRETILHARVLAVLDKPILRRNVRVDLAIANPLRRVVSPHPISACGNVESLQQEGLAGFFYDVGHLNAFFRRAGQFSKYHSRVELE